jgi:hypothetical protein
MLIKSFKEDLKKIKRPKKAVRPKNPLAGITAPASIQKMQRAKVQPRYEVRKVQKVISVAQVRPQEKVQIQRMERRPIERSEIHPANDDEGYRALFGSSTIVQPRRTEIRPQVRPEIRKEKIHPSNDTSGNFLVNMGGSGMNPLFGGSNLVNIKKRKQSNDPTGSSSFW